MVDRFTLPILGRRRGWLILTQIALIVAIAFMAFQQPKQALQLLAINAIVIAFISATQDIAVDAYRTDVLEKLEMGAGAAVFILGYRIALLVAGALALILADKLPWSSVYLFMAGTMVIGILPPCSHRNPRKLALQLLLLMLSSCPLGNFSASRDYQSYSHACIHYPIQAR